MWLLLVHMGELTQLILSAISGFFFWGGVRVQGSSEHSSGFESWGFRVAGMFFIQMFRVWDERFVRVRNLWPDAWEV